jgi:hypothetical protein
MGQLLQHHNTTPKAPVAFTNLTPSTNTLLDTLVALYNTQLSSVSFFLVLFL